MNIVIFAVAASISRMSASRGFVFDPDQIGQTRQALDACISNSEITMKLPIQHPLLHLITPLCFLIPLFAPTQLQTKDQDVFAPIPAPLRARLVERLRLLTNYQRGQQWDKQYDLLSVLFTQGETKQEFIKLSRRWYAQGFAIRLRDFTPRSITVHDDSPNHGFCTIFGCAKVHEKGRIVQLYASVTAWKGEG